MPAITRMARSYKVAESVPLANAPNPVRWQARSYKSAS